MLFWMILFFLAKKQSSIKKKHLFIFSFFCPELISDNLAYLYGPKNLQIIVNYFNNKKKHLFPKSLIFFLRRIMTKMALF